MTLDHDLARKAFFKTTVVPPKKLESIVSLLSLFSQFLSMRSNEIAVHHSSVEPAVVTQAKEFIEQHQSEDMTLGQLAAACHTSIFYFCKLFKKATGLHFTEYLSRVRIERAKNLLLNPNHRISEIAYEVGFQSLTHFNRVFKTILGESPSEYRARLPLEPKAIPHPSRQKLTGANLSTQLAPALNSNFRLSCALKPHLPQRFLLLSKHRSQAS